MQVDEVRDQIKALKAQFIEDAEHTKDEIKFDLMHEKSPQVSTLKDLLAQQVQPTAYSELLFPVWTCVFMFSRFHEIRRTTAEHCMIAIEQTSPLDPVWDSHCKHIHKEGTWL